jgi:hypothetical protein
LSRPIINLLLSPLSNHDPPFFAVFEKKLLSMLNGDGKRNIKSKKPLKIFEFFMKMV